MTESSAFGEEKTFLEALTKVPSSTLGLINQAKFVDAKTNSHSRGGKGCLLNPPNLL